MSNGNAWERWAKLTAMVGKLVLDGHRSPSYVADILQRIVDNPQPVVAPQRFELYLAPSQKKEDMWVKGFDLEKHLNDEGLIGRAVSLDDPQVKSWLANPETYPWEYKDKAIYLWKSIEDRSNLRSVACLNWRVGLVVVHFDLLVDEWNADSPALLRAVV